MFCSLLNVKKELPSYTCIFVLIPYFIEAILSTKKNDAKRGGWKKICTEVYDHIEEVDYRKTGEGVLTFCTQYKFKIPELKTQLKNTWAVFVFRTYHCNICKRITEQSFQTGEPMYCRQPEVFRKSADIKTAKRLTAKQI